MQACPVCGGPGGVLLLYTVSPCDRCNAKMDISRASTSLLPIETPFGMGILIKSFGAPPKIFAISYARWVYEDEDEPWWWAISGKNTTDQLVARAKSAGLKISTAPTFDFLFSKDPQNPDRIWV